MNLSRYTNQAFIQQHQLAPLADLQIIHQVKSTHQLDDVLTLFNQVCSKGFDMRTITGLVTAYSGHQFGTFNPALGDGRVLNLDVNSVGLCAFQLKGSGQTPFSYGNDGRLALRSAVKEYLTNIALAGLGIPTIESLALAFSSERLQQQQLQHSSLLLRTAQTFTRIGHFEFLYASSSTEDKQHDLGVLITDCLAASATDLGLNKTLDTLAVKEQAQMLLNNVVEKTAYLAAKWQSAAFCHGTLNSDNMSIAGLTLDSATGEFMSTFDPSMTPNAIDQQGRYAFENQPRQCLFNLHVLAQCLTLFLSPTQQQHSLKQFYQSYYQHYSMLMLAKLGLNDFIPADRQLLSELLQCLYDNKLDYNLFFQWLSQVDSLQLLNKNNRIQATDIHQHTLANTDQLIHWLRRYQMRIEQGEISTCQRHQLMMKSNPNFVLTKPILNMAIEHVEHADFTALSCLINKLSHPFLTT
ncbi:protein adenylyltransferase SelO family protein [Psychrobium sp. 1_MG-2023]|uniref:protein adenylyltransferase SelO family protein n=1 Tax=Psychrobium sp. 1_MG-2023 TaxID=3062624 RepID=UPI000C342892|nr:protein adenylyltransferase SelO family protein [Psychrobium sp. 1_MG-2023]MDP2560165.1 protein adenylyltransferase SelO family protein [Psychrobium sp. 1_MG-2023]PKF56976.1 hypothetical protein CW748_07730 [Alteromonadales bacterium alter-6D02]